MSHTSQQDALPSTIVPYSSNQEPRASVTATEKERRREPEGLHRASHILSLEGKCVPSTHVSHSCELAVTSSTLDLKSTVHFMPRKKKKIKC